MVQASLIICPMLRGFWWEAVSETTNVSLTPHVVQCKKKNGCGSLYDADVGSGLVEGGNCKDLNTEQFIVTNIIHACPRARMACSMHISYCYQYY